MSYQLAVAIGDPVWSRVCDALRARRIELIQESLDLGATDQARRDAAVRVDEISLLLDAPGQTLARTQASHAAATDHRSHY